MQLEVRPHHVALTVEDLDRAAGWYAEALGFATLLAFSLPGSVRGAMLRTPAGAGIELFEVPGSQPGLVDADPPEAMRTRGFGHVGLEVADLHAAFAAVVAAGASVVWEPRDAPEPGRQMAFVHDPDGNLVELIGPPSS
jgi:catechol 2,3-dioxygenase-like lactoylglutathione lyase family enzyme